MLPLQVPLQDTNANMPMDLQLELQRQQVFERIALRHITDEESYLRRWSPRSSLPSEIRVELKNRELWKKFHAEDTEMIITKLGRRMFPSVQIAVHGLNKHCKYYAIMEIVLVSEQRHKYCGNGEGNDNEKTNENKNNTRGWSFAGPAEPQSPFERRIFSHPDNPATGEYWMQNLISFSKLKLTNNVGHHHNNVVLTSMHKYIPKIWLIRCSEATNLDELFSYPASVFSFKETEFIAVTAYQNANITKLKIDNNPFAKGFRETGQSRCKRKYHQMSQSDEEESNSDSSESNSGANNLDDLAQKSAKRSKVENSGDYDDVKSSILIAEDQKSPESTHHECETSSAFHRPWLDSPSRKNPTEPMIAMVPMVPSASSLLSTVHDLNCFRYDFDHYLQFLPFIEQQNMLKYYQYYYPTLQSDFHVRKL